MRKLRMWYGLVIIWSGGHVKTVVRKVGEQMKVYGRKLEHLGDNTTPKWSRELFQKCYLADAEVHVGAKVFVGRINSIYQKPSGKDSLLVINLKSGTLRRGIPSTSEVLEDCEIEISGYGPPVVIKEAGYDCIWTGHKKGYLAIFLH